MKLPGGWTWGYLYPTTATVYLKSWNMLTQIKGEGDRLGAKNSFFFLWLSIKSGPTCPKWQVWEVWWMSWVSCGLALRAPKDHDKLWLRIHSLTQKMFLLFDTHFLPTVLHVLGLFYLYISVSQPSVSQAP